MRGYQNSRQLLKLPWGGTRQHFWERQAAQLACRPWWGLHREVAVMLAQSGHNFESTGHAL